MADLSLTYSDLLAEVGYFLGYGTVTGSYTTDQTARADAAVQDGLRMFYYPEDVDALHFNGWTFLHPTTTLAMVSGTATYTLPAAFERFDGGLTYAEASGYPPIEIIDEADIRGLTWPATFTGPPAYGAIRAIASTSTAVQTYQLLLWPTPDITATLSYRYYAAPLKLATSGSVLYPLGPPFHALTIKEACKAAAETAENDEEGVHWARFRGRLKASIDYDRRSTQRFYGQNKDSSYLIYGYAGD